MDCNEASNSNNQDGYQARGAGAVEEGYWYWKSEAVETQHDSEDVDAIGKGG